MSSESWVGRFGAAWFLALSLAMGLTPMLVAIDGVGLGPADYQFWWSERIALGVEAKAERTRGEGPRVILIGGSSVPFAVNAPSLETRIGATVLPYGLNAGLGIDAIAAGAAELIGPGDLVVLAPELQHFRPEGTTNKALRSDWLVLRGAASDERLASFPTRQWLALRSRWHRYYRYADWMAFQELVRWIARRRGDEKWMAFPGPHGYETRYVDADGNVTFPRPAPRAREQWGSLHSLPIDAAEYDLEGSNGARTLAWLAGVCRERGAALAVMPSCHAVPEWAGPEFLEMVKQREEDWMRLADGLGAIRLLQPGETAVGVEGAFDSYQHLNELGAAEVESRLAPALARVLGELGTDRVLTRGCRAGPGGEGAD